MQAYRKAAGRWSHQTSSVWAVLTHGSGYEKKRTFRLCSSLLHHNADRVSDTYPLQLVDNCFDILKETKSYQNWMLYGDIRRCQSKVKGKSETKFPSYLGNYQYRRILFGLRITFATFQRTYDILPSVARLKTCLFIINYIVFFFETWTPTLEGHWWRADTTSSGHCLF